MRMTVKGTAAELFRPEDFQMILGVQSEIRMAWISPWQGSERRRYQRDDRER